MADNVLVAEDVRELIRGRDPATPLEVEVGCGNGHFLASYAAARPAVDFLGIDIREARCRKAARKAQLAGLSNLTVVCGRAEEILRLLPEDGVEACHIYFPDPWPKSRHRRRRFLRGPQLDLLAGRLRAGGRIFFVTDYYDYYVQTKVLFLLHPLFALSLEPPPREALQSLFGQIFTDWGKDFYYATGRRVSSGHTSPDKTL